MPHVDPTLTPEANWLLRQERQREASVARGSWYRMLAVGGLLVTVFALIYFLPARQTQAVIDQKQSLVDAASTSADANLRLCLAGDETARKLAQAGLCELAQELKKAIAAAEPVALPGPTGVSGVAGAPGGAGQSGRGVATTAIVNGHFQVTYTDGVVEDKGVIQGKDGAPGKSITASAIVADHLMLTYTDGSSEDVGMVMGRDGMPGPSGPPGTPGRGVAGTAMSNGDLILTYTDGTTEDVGPLPKGSDGQPPSGWTVTQPDGSTYTCSRASGFDSSAPQYTCTAPPSSSASSSVTPTT